MALLVYVNDIVLTGASVAAIDEIKSKINDRFRLKDLGNLKRFLSLEIAMCTTWLW